MGMTKAALDMQMQAETQKAIGILQRNMTQLDRILQIIDSNVRQSHVVLFQDITQLRVRVNFLMNELKTNMTPEESKALEERFKTFAQGEAEKMDKNIADAIAAKERANEVAAAEATLKTEGATDVVQ